MGHVHGSPGPKLFFDRLTLWLGRRLDGVRDEIVTEVTDRVTRNVAEEISPRLEEMSREFEDLKTAVGDGLADEYEAGVRDQRTALGLPDLPQEVTDAALAAAGWPPLECPQPGAGGWRRDPRTGVWWHSQERRPSPRPHVQEVRRRRAGAVGESP